MRFFDWVDFQYLTLAVFIGLICAILIYLAWAAYPHRIPAGTPDEIAEGREPPGGPGYEKNPITPFLILTYVIIACWAFLYMIYNWASSSNF